MSRPSCVLRGSARRSSSASSRKADGTSMLAARRGQEGLVGTFDSFVDALKHLGQAVTDDE